MAFETQRLKMVKDLEARSIIKTKWMAKAMSKVKRELFMPEKYKEQAYVHRNQAFPIPPYTSRQTISAPGTYPMFYEPLKLRRGDRFLEIGTGSGYGAALAREIVAREGKVITIERNEVTYKFGKQNLQKAGYQDILVIHGDGTKGYPPEAPYQKICVTASFTKVPEPLKNQLAKLGRLIMPIGPTWLGQELTLLKKSREGRFTRESKGAVTYVPLTGKYGYEESQ